MKFFFGFKPFEWILTFWGIIFWGCDIKILTIREIHTFGTKLLT